MRLNKDVRDGVLPEALPADFVQEAIAIQNGGEASRCAREG